ncbi:hypothetical protein GGX14DRAFT_667151 [Mycena pura]|uniref:BHLH domain-containing protein n=1 Tax=Mycena pura TaxID=153505 RepID=A0AAD6V287_9AGAR|nr:hypothetical protein GGX14DRAFT_667151 [Mycena pura]
MTAPREAQQEESLPMSPVQPEPGSSTFIFDAVSGALISQRPSQRPRNIAERRASHNAVERQRRDTLNGRFLELAALLPPLDTLRRPSKASIVRMSMVHIRAGHRHRALAAEQLRALAAECDALRAEANYWLERAGGLAPLPTSARGEAFDALLAELEQIDSQQAGDNDDDDGYHSDGGGGGGGGDTHRSPDGLHNVRPQQRTAPHDQGYQSPHLAPQFNSPFAYNVSPPTPPWDIGAGHGGAAQPWPYGHHTAPHSTPASSAPAAHASAPQHLSHARVHPRGRGATLTTDHPVAPTRGAVTAVAHLHPPADPYHPRCTPGPPLQHPQAVSHMPVCAYAPPGLLMLAADRDTEPHQRVPIAMPHPHAARDGELPVVPQWEYYPEAHRRSSIRQNSWTLRSRSALMPASRGRTNAHYPEALYSLQRVENWTLRSVV